MAVRFRWIVGVAAVLVGCSMGNGEPRLSAVEGDQDVSASFPTGWDRDQVDEAVEGLSEAVACVDVIDPDRVLAMADEGGLLDQLGVDLRPEDIGWIVKVAFDAGLRYEERIPLAAQAARALKDAGATWVIRFDHAKPEESWVTPRCAS